MTIWEVGAAASKPAGLLVCHAAAAPYALHGFKLARTAQIGLLAPGIHVFIWHESVLISNACIDIDMSAGNSPWGGSAAANGKWVCVHLPNLLVWEAQRLVVTAYKISSILGWHQQLFEHIMLRVTGKDLCLCILGFVHFFLRVACGERLCVHLRTVYVIPLWYM